ncbi:MarR family transcriptional regulator [Streptomyces albiflavescens]|uniref:MarR family transcriptional regulator n=1 Tax=Streptomyces albiflavescens TaxID=1623582 RepID=A0A917YB23_9ACTN|nr:MarR family winged helix-turn-helix transcriptional regulator [Streptomyces albiflavescens]GGN82413.1 MarR family transcriptional regulator [Streptomyces albiflavescens]
MNDVKPSQEPDGPTGTLAFRLGTVGTLVTARFAAAVEDLGVKPKHVGLLSVIGSGAPASQQDVARTMGVVPSLVVTLADQLEELGAIERVRDPDDRRRHRLGLTPEGHTLLAECTARARALDEELTAGLSTAERDTLSRAMGVLAREAGLP